MSERKGTKALELWCKRLVKDCPNVQIENMTTSWRNGIAFCALVHHFRPDLIDVSSLNPENIYENNQLAFSVAEKHLGIPALLDPEDMVENEVPDRLSILTYLSQFYQRLGHTEKMKKSAKCELDLHTEGSLSLPPQSPHEYNNDLYSFQSKGINKVNTKASENESKSSLPSSTQSTAQFKFGKAGLDKCAACDLPVYLAQRLIVSHKLYHRRCFRCSKCSGHLNPKNFVVIEGSDFLCDSCKNEKTLSKFLNNNDQMGMLAFTDDQSESGTKPQDEEKPISPKLQPKRLSILERINKFENNMEKESIENKLSNITLNKNVHNKHKDLSTSSCLSSTSGILSEPSSTETDSKTADQLVTESQSPIQETVPENSYKTNVNKLTFLQTQLSGEVLETDSKVDDDGDVVTKPSKENFECNVGDVTLKNSRVNNECSAVNQEESNITDDIRLAKTHSEPPRLDTLALEENDLNKNKELSISVPPRRKKKSPPKSKKEKQSNKSIQEYPDNLNPFSDEEDETEENGSNQKQKVSTNPFGSSDEEDDEVPPIPSSLKTVNTTPAKRHITALNPFWSDGEEPSSEDEPNNDSTSMYKASMATSTPNLPGVESTRRKKGRAPPPPPALTVDPPPLDQPCTSMDDVASISSYSSYNSTVYSDQKSFGKITPRLKKRLAPTPPDSVSTASVSGSMEGGLDCTMRTNTSDQSGRKVKGPAPGLPLPERREVKMQMSPGELQVQLDLLETQQLGLERQGVLIEQMIRDKCEGDEECTAPPEEVEDLVIQLCELVNEKNDLFRKQTELMYIRRQQRLEQEQADIEHEIRVIQSRPAVNRIDADKAREEQLVSRLVQIVLLRDELVQQIDAERRRERREDLAIAACIASKRAQRNSGSNSSSMKSFEVAPIPKKNKMKDKVKKQLKKAKHSLISKKKDDSGERKEAKTEKEK